MKEIEKFLEEFPNKTIGNEKINDLLSYKKNSIWWFYKNRLEGDHLPNPLPKMEEIKNNKKTSKTKIFAMKKAFGINEKLKIHFSKKQKINFNTNKKILCLIPTIRKKGNYIDRIDKILKEIDKKEDTNYKIEFFEAQSKLTKLEKNNLFYRHLTKDIIKKSNSEAKKLNKQWNKIKKEITFKTNKENKIFLNYIPTFDFLFSKEMLFSIISSYETFYKLLKENQINCVLLDSSGSIIERSMIKAASKLKIPCLRLLHGGLYLPTRKWDYPDNLYLCVPNIDVKERVIELGAKEQNIFLTGATFLEDIPEKKEKKSERKQILFCTTSLIEESVMKKEKYFKIIENIVGTIKNIENTELIIKLHPGEIHKEDYQKIIERLKLKNVKILQKTTKKELYDLINESDLTISFYSTILLESNLTSTTTALITHEELTNTQQTRFNKNKAIIELKYNEDPTKLIKNYLFDKEKIDSLKKPREELIERFFYKLDNKMPERVMKVIQNLINSQFD